MQWRGPALTHNRLAILLAHGRLQLLGMVQMRNECRANLDQQGFQFFVLGAGNQGFVDGVEDGLAYLDFPHLCLLPNRLS